MTLKPQLNPMVRIGLIMAGTSLLLVAPTQLVHAQSPQVVQAQSKGDPATIKRELGLSRSQMRQLRGMMQDYQAELEDILTPEQLEEMQSLREAAQQGSSVSAEDALAELDLSEDQATQLEQTRASLRQDLAGVLTPAQLEKLEEMGRF